jgi:cullin-associated NEDD8-dissociated protein 1
MADFALHGRFMSLNDLMTEIKMDPTSFLGEEAIENKVLKQVLQLVEDKISEVKNQAVKWCVYLFVYKGSPNFETM